MALGTMVVVEKSASLGPVRYDEIAVPGDGAYPAGGTPGFTALVRTALAVGSVEIIGLMPGDCGGYHAVYDKANDKLKVYRNGAINVPQVEVTAATDLSATTFRMVVVSK
jgi:hypothetical protein